MGTGTAITSFGKKIALESINLDKNFLETLSNSKEDSEVQKTIRYWIRSMIITKIVNIIAKAFISYTLIITLQHIGFPLF